MVVISVDFWVCCLFTFGRQTGFDVRKELSFCFTNKMATDQYMLPLTVVYLTPVIVLSIHFNNAESTEEKAFEDDSKRYSKSTKKWRTNDK